MGESGYYREWAPPAAWRAVVACCWEQRVETARVQRVLPDGHADLLLDQDGALAVVGLHDEVDLPSLPAGTWLRGVRLRPEAVAPALRATASSLRNRTVSLEDVLGDRETRRLADPRRLDAWLRAVRPRARTTAAVRLLATQSVDDVARALGTSGRQLQRVFHEDVGLSPKIYQRILRLQRAVAAIDRHADLATAAAVAGYADQPHMTREVRALSGLTPAALLRERRSMGP